MFWFKNPPAGYTGLALEPRGGGCGEALSGKGRAEAYETGWREEIREGGERLEGVGEEDKSTYGRRATNNSCLLPHSGLGFALWVFHTSG